MPQAIQAQMVAQHLQTITQAAPSRIQVAAVVAAHQQAPRMVAQVAQTLATVVKATHQARLVPTVSPIVAEVAAVLVALVLSAELHQATADQVK